MKRKIMTNRMTKPKHLGGGFIKEKKTSDRESKKKKKNHACLPFEQSVGQRGGVQPSIRLFPPFPITQGAGKQVSREQSLRHTHTRLEKKVGHVHTNAWTRLGAFHLGRERLRTT